MDNRTTSYWPGEQVPRLLISNQVKSLCGQDRRPVTHGKRRYVTFVCPDIQRRPGLVTRVYWKSNNKELGEWNGEVGVRGPESPENLRERIGSGRESSTKWTIEIRRRAQRTESNRKHKKEKGLSQTWSRFWVKREVRRVQSWDGPSYSILWWPKMIVFDFCLSTKGLRTGIIVSSHARQREREKTVNPFIGPPVGHMSTVNRVKDMYLRRVLTFWWFKNERRYLLWPVFLGVKKKDPKR